MKIRSKAQFFEMWEAGLLGNRTQLWRNIDPAYDWAYRHKHKEVGFREIRKGAGSGKWEKVPWYLLFPTARQWQEEGRSFIMDDGAPDEYRTLQGEICRTIRGLEGYLSLGSHLPMRPDMAAGNMRHYGYVQTARLLDLYMDPPSRDDVDALLDLYPEATIEFTCFSVSAGVLQRNTIFWETRDY